MDAEVIDEWTFSVSFSCYVINNLVLNIHVKFVVDWKEQSLIKLPQQG